MQSSQEIFQCWADEHSVWTRWAKPVLFAEMYNIGSVHKELPDWRNFLLNGFPTVKDGTALIVDLPGEKSVAWGMALAAAGYRPIPLFNAVSAVAAIVDVEIIKVCLNHWAEELTQMNIGEQAPPAFLIDANREGRRALIAPGRFDNRSVLFPQDFPSAGFLLAHDIHSVTVIKEENKTIEEDLAHVLYRWQEKSISILIKLTADNKPRQEVIVDKPTNFRSLFYRIMVLMGLKRNSAGGFGSVVPDPGSGGGGGFG